MPCRFLPFLLSGFLFINMYSSLVVCVSHVAWVKFCSSFYGATGVTSLKFCFSFYGGTWVTSLKFCSSFYGTSGMTSPEDHQMFRSTANVPRALDSLCRTSISEFPSVVILLPR